MVDGVAKEDADAGGDRGGRGRDDYHDSFMDLVAAQQQYGGWSRLHTHKRETGWGSTHLAVDRWLDDVSHNSPAPSSSIPDLILDARARTSITACTATRAIYLTRA